MNRRRTTAVLIAASALGLCALAADPGEVATAPASQPTSARADYDAMVGEIVSDLAARSFQRRQRAGERVERLGPEAAEALGRAYRAADNPEVRSRIRHHGRAVAAEWLRRRSPGFVGVRFYLLARDGPLAAAPVAAPDGPGPTDKSIFVADVLPESPAERAGLQAGDRIIAVAGRDVNDYGVNEDFMAQISAIPPGETLTLTLHRQAGPTDVELTVGRRLDHLPESLREAELHRDLERFWAGELTPTSQPTSSASAPEAATSAPTD